MIYTSDLPHISDDTEMLELVRSPILRLSDPEPPIEEDRMSIDHQRAFEKGQGMEWPYS